jgi:hypothetical protein
MGQKISINFNNFKFKSIIPDNNNIIEKNNFSNILILDPKIITSRSKSYPNNLNIINKYELITQQRSNTYNNDSNSNYENELFIQPRLNTYTCNLNIPDDDKLICGTNYLDLECKKNINIDDILLNGNSKLNYLNFKKSSNKVIIICIDFIDSVSILKLKGIKNIIDINRKFYNDVYYIINKLKYKYIKIYEIVGDSYIFTINFPNIKQYKYPASQCILFCKNLINMSCSYIDLRIGIAYDQVHYGMINNHIRIFGDAINLASRLENQASKFHINCCQNFYNKITKENKLKLNFDNKKCYLKGFGEYNYSIINIKSIKELIN